MRHGHARGGRPLGDEQAGHIRLIGVDLYRHLRDLALARACGGTTFDDRTIELSLDVAGVIPARYVADPKVRINLYAKLSRLRDARQIGEFAEEIQDRFGDPPPPIRALLDLARVSEMARQLGVRRLDAGPRAIALTFEADQIERWRKALGKSRYSSLLRWNEERLLSEQPTEPSERMAAVIASLEQLEGET